MNNTCLPVEFVLHIFSRRANAGVETNGVSVDDVDEHRVVAADPVVGGSATGCRGRRWKVPQLMSRAHRDLVPLESAYRHRVSAGEGALSR